jgi:membrane-associated PAP2 superfamily phosphatase
LSPQKTGIKFWLSHLLWPLIAVFLSLYFLEYRNLDLSISRYFFDETTQRFPLQFDYLYRNILHGYLNYPAAIIFLCLVGFLLATWKLKYRRYRALLIYLITSILLAAIVTVVTKSNSIRACAWDLQVFNGASPHLGWLDALPANLKPGHCWPGGFATAGFCLFAFYFASRIHASKRTAFLLLAGILVYGNALGIIQVMRGAHLFSHHVWTAIICWYVSLACFFLYRHVMYKRANVMIS